MQAPLPRGPDPARRDPAAVTDRTSLRSARARLQSAQTYAEWLDAAHAVDHLTGAEAWRADDDSGAYHADLLRQQRDAMRQQRERGRAQELARLLTHSLYRNLADIQSPELYETALVGTKHLVSAYLDECEASLLWLAQSDAFEPGEQLRRFEQAERVFGRSALMLSGGATFGFYHFGVVKGLLEHDALPDVICGSSAGAMIAAGICARTDDELHDLFANPAQIRLDGLHPAGLRRFASTGAWMQGEQLREVLEHNIGPASFQEAFVHSGRTLCISVSPTRVRQKPRLLSRLASPDVLIASAALASSALPGLFPPVVLEMRADDGGVEPYIATETWIDGSIHGDLPKMRLARLHNINHFIVSQTNPHVLPVAHLRAGDRGARPALTGLASTVARNQGATAADFVRRLSGSGVVGRVSTQLHNVASQDYAGDIEIVPRFNPWMYRKIVSNPTLDDLRFFILEGQRAVWPKLAMIREHTRISRAFDRCLALLRAKG